MRVQVVGWYQSPHRRQPVFAPGNSDGNPEMVQWTIWAPGPGFGLLIHYTNERREYAYDGQSELGRLDDMRADWRRVVSFQ